jgi:hypothetical protein
MTNGTTLRTTKMRRYIPFTEAESRDRTNTESDADPRNAIPVG